MHHSSTDEDIMNVLKEFTVDFLLKGYDTLVHDLYLQLVSSAEMQFDTSHFFWLVTYFLKFAAQLELDPELLCHVLSHETVSYLVFQGVWLYEELEIGYKLAGADLKPILRRLHLVRQALRRVLSGSERCFSACHRHTRVLASDRYLWEVDALECGGLEGIEKFKSADLEDGRV